MDERVDHLKEQSLPDLLKQLSQETATLVRQEIELAKAEATEKGQHILEQGKAELSDKGKKVGTGAGFMGAAGALGLLALMTLTAFLVIVLNEFMPLWLAALIVAVIYAAVAAFLAMKGRDKIKEATPLFPQRTVETAKEDIKDVKEDMQWTETPTRSDRR
jgi:Flp pilus assembly protein TadB